MKLLRAAAARVRSAVTAHRTTWVQDVLALSTVATVIILAALQMPIPEILSGIAWVIIGYFFGTLKNQPPQAETDTATPLQRTRHGRGRSRLIHFQCVKPDPQASP